MKLATFDQGRLGVVRDDRITDISDLVPLPPGFWPPVGMVKLIADFAALKPRIADAVSTRKSVPLASVRLEAPVQWPNKLIAYPANYHAHAQEMRSSYRADSQGFFLKANSSISGPVDPIVLPAITGPEIHHECELAIFIGRGGRGISLEHAMDHIFGYACLMDMTVRGKQERVMRKSFDTFCPIGPYIVTADEVSDPAALNLQLTVNGVVKQKANTSDLILDIPNMIVMASSVMTLYPGDIIATGTPAGVGPLAAGDEVTISIAQVGSMTLPVVQGDIGGNLAFQTK
jgi:2-keto-4-pentenoate hydratase/2-oxohepta-3-ene-1,7-dioic acid hydratase in catechol pathway